MFLVLLKWGPVDTKSPLNCVRRGLRAALEYFLVVPSALVFPWMMQTVGLNLTVQGCLWHLVNGVDSADLQCELRSHVLSKLPVSLILESDYPM